MRNNLFKRSWILGLLILMLSINCNARAPLNDSLAPMLEKVLPSVVNIRAQIKPQLFMAPRGTQRKSPQDNADPLQPDRFISLGSGVIVDAKNGYILTNAHVIDDAQVVTVTLGDSRHFTAKIIGADKPSDIAVLQIKAKNLTAITMADSNQLKVGEMVAAIGNPFGLSQSVTSGIISGLRRTTLGIENYENFIQIDAPINPGNSGGALVNQQGQLVGINTAIISPTMGSGVGFAIPSNMARSVMNQLIEYGNVKRGALGIGAQDITPELAAAFGLDITKGAVVTQILKNSPGEQAGLNVGDVLISVNGTNIESANDVVNSIAFLRVDSKANINILRNNKKMDLTAHITDPEKRRQTDQKKDPFLYGISLKNFSISTPIHGDVKGVLVVDVDMDSNAWSADLRPTDVIISANQQKITSIDDLKKIAADAKDTLVVNVLRGPGSLFLIINKET